MMQVPTSWISLYDVVRGEDVKGHSLEIWFVPTPIDSGRMLFVYTARMESTNDGNDIGSLERWGQWLLFLLFCGGM